MHQELQANDLLTLSYMIVMSLDSLPITILALALEFRCLYISMTSSCSFSTLADIVKGERVNIDLKKHCNHHINYCPTHSFTYLAITLILMTYLSILLYII